MLCNECAANLRDGNCWEVLMSSFVFVFWQNPGLWWFVQNSQSPIGQKLGMIKDSTNWINLWKLWWIRSLFCPGCANRENEVLHAIADSERCLGAWYGVIFVCWLLFVLMIEMVVQTNFWARQPAFRELDSGLCMSNFHIFFVSSALWKNKTCPVRKFSASTWAPWNHPQFTFQVSCVPSRGIGSRFGTWGWWSRTGPWNTCHRFLTTVFPIIHRILSGSPSFRQSQNHTSHGQRWAFRSMPIVMSWNMSIVNPTGIGSPGMWATLLGSFREEQEEHQQLMDVPRQFHHQLITRRQGKATLAHTDAWTDSRCHHCSPGSKSQTTLPKYISNIRRCEAELEPWGVAKVGAIWERDWYLMGIWKRMKFGVPGT